MQYQLSTFGIPQSVLPLTPSNEATLAGHMYFLDRLRTEEENTISVVDMSNMSNMSNMSVDTNSTNLMTTMTTVPGPHDVLFGRNKYNHSGNAAWRGMVDRKLEKYEAASKLKRLICPHRSYARLKHWVENS